MKNIAFHSNQLGIRGTEVALYDYALYNETILGNKSYIISNAHADLTTLEKFQKRFPVFLYKNFNEVPEFLAQNEITFFYAMKSGENDGKVVPGVRNLVHVVFQNKDVHGDRYAYISSWLANKMGISESYVPYIVTLPKPDGDYRASLNIPRDNVVIGRHGGFNEFDIPFVYDAIYRTLAQRSNITFLFMNTRPFGPAHPNIIHVEGSYDLQIKSNFIETCDSMIHARQLGESFGLAICEFLHNDKPVISWLGGYDQHHIQLMGDNALWYQDGAQLEQIFINLPKKIIGLDSKAMVAQFSPENVMERFNNIFLK
jgi:hypothetical protein